MPGLTIGWEYLTGYAVATDPASRERAEWPPHPGRVFMAMAAAYFETGENPADADALRWLETLGDPHLQLPTSDGVFERSNVLAYVPVNDKAGPSAATLQSAPALTRSKQPRTFPRVYVGDHPCFMHWPDATPTTDQLKAMEHLCGKVTRIGHSSSLVRMWVSSYEQVAWSGCDHLVIDDVGAELHTRTISSGMLEMLTQQYGEKQRQCKAAIEDQINSLSAQKKAVKGKGSKERKAEIDAQIQPLEAESSKVFARPPVRPKLGLWLGYRRVDAAKAADDLAQSHFDTDLLVLTQIDGPTLPVISTLSVTHALRRTIMSHSVLQPVPMWVSGHQSDGQPTRGNDDGHLACIPLPFVGHAHADGHLLGVGLAFPRSIDRRDRGRVLGKLLLNEKGQPQAVKLTLGGLGIWTVTKRDWSESRGTLQPEAWTAHPNGATQWASVTPVVLDRFPKADRTTDRTGWTDEVVAIVTVACERIGLPAPSAIDIDTTCWHRGSPRAIGKRRRLRESANYDPGGASLGDGFPAYPAKGTNAPRPQVHVRLCFDQPVVGPVLLGAGRYMGYGLCKPLNGGRDEHDQP